MGRGEGGRQGKKVGREGTGERKKDGKARWFGLVDTEADRIAGHGGVEGSVQVNEG